MWDPADESARPQRKLELTLQVLRRQVRELATRSGSRWEHMTPKEARKAIAVHMRVPLEELDRHRKEITFLIKEYQSTAAAPHAETQVASQPVAACPSCRRHLLRPGFEVG